MAENKIDVIVGAQIAGLVSGINQAKGVIEGLASPISAVIGAFSGVAEAIGAAFAVDKLKEFAVEMGKLGEEISRSTATRRGRNSRPSCWK